ncbi:hypothetical protein [[Phormidium ambiguum] IAM M-71]|uniref:hypothetical protein n=1 Tax=[Phormidium ambiguum] IAM M-71 TaxID=454136 RepID=UPI0011615341|nr:hypothetical protein [Phormidium ambiguum]
MNHSVIILAQGGLWIRDASHYDSKRSCISEAVMVTGSTFRYDHNSCRVGILPAFEILFWRNLMLPPTSSLFTVNLSSKVYKRDKTIE